MITTEQKFGICKSKPLMEDGKIQDKARLSEILNYCFGHLSLRSHLIFWQGIDHIAHNSVS